MAVMAYNSSVHKMLSLTASDGLTPAHLFLVRRIDLAIHAATRSTETVEIKKPEQTAVEVQENVLKALSWMQQSRAKYEQQMETNVLNKIKKTRRQFDAGELVKLHKKIGNKTTSKLSRTKEGPYRVVLAPDQPSKHVYELTLLGGTGKRVRAHADSIEAYYDIDDLWDPAEEEQDSDDLVDTGDADADDENYKVESICGERGNVQRGTKQFLVKWVGYDEPSWNDAELGAGAVPPGTYCQTPQCHLVKRPRPRGLPD